MDAVKFLVTRDRMCRSFNGRCTGCEVNERMGADEVCIHYMTQHPREVVEIVERWAKEHPLRTRQSEFLKMFPRASMTSNGTIDFCPESFDEEFACPEKGKFYRGERECLDCRRKFWLEEIEDDEAEAE